MTPTSLKHQKEIKADLEFYKRKLGNIMERIISLQLYLNQIRKECFLNSEEDIDGVNASSVFFNVKQAYLRQEQEKIFPLLRSYKSIKNVIKELEERLEKEEHGRN